MFARRRQDESTSSEPLRFRTTLRLLVSAMLGKKTRRTRFFAKQSNMAGQKMNSVRSLSPGGAVKLVCEVLGVSRSNVSAQLARPTDWQDGRKSRQTDDAPVVNAIRRVIGDLSSYRYRRVLGVLREERQSIRLVVFNAKCLYRVVSTYGLLI